MPNSNAKRLNELWFPSRELKIRKNLELCLLHCPVPSLCTSWTGTVPAVGRHWATPHRSSLNSLIPQHLALFFASSADDIEAAVRNVGRSLQLSTVQLRNATHTAEFVLLNCLMRIPMYLGNWHGVVGWSPTAPRNTSSHPHLRIPKCSEIVELKLKGTVL
jgi:hypothetical protein